MKRRTFPVAGVLAVALAALLASCSSTSTSPEPAAPADAPAGAGQQQPGNLPAQEAERRSLLEEKNRILIQQYLAQARALMQENRYDQAEAAVTQALAIDDKNAEALALYREIGRVLGYRVESMESVRETIAARERARLDMQRFEAERRFQQGEEQLARGEAEAAARSFETAANIIEFNPLLATEMADFRERARAKLAEAEALQRKQSEEVTRDTHRQAYEALRAEEEAARRRREEAHAHLLSEATERYDREQFDEAERLVDRVLKEDPFNTTARRMKQSIRDSRHDVNERNYQDQKRENVKLWREEIEKTRIPNADILTWPSQEYWNDITRKRMVFTPAFDEEETDTEKRLRARMESETLPFQFESAKIPEIFDYIKNVGNIPIVVDPEVQSELAAEDLQIKLNLESATIKAGLNIVLAYKPELAYTFKNDVVFITKKAKAHGKPQTHVHDIRDLTLALTDFTGPSLNLTAKREEGQGIFGGVTEGKPVVSQEDLQELVRENVGSGTWEQEGVAIDISSGRLIVVHNPTVQREVTRFLNELRRFTGSVVTVEARFLSVRDNYLQEIGVDWRGLGGVQGTLANLDDVTNGADDVASQGWDNNGAGTPTAPTASPSSGFFLDNGEDGDVRARTENIFDRNLGKMLSAVGGFTAQVAILDDLQLNMVIRAVEKTDKATLLTAPRLTVFNTQRSNITLVNQVSYVKDYDVEVAQTSFIADPVVDVLQDGLVMDVRPTISNDRKFVTLELRPTVATLRQPIRTLTTTLGALTTPVTIQLPELNIQSAATTVMVPDGGTVMIGGLRNSLNVQRKSEIPWLAQIPIVGVLFKKTGTSDEVGDLIVVVTARIGDLQEQEIQLRR
jgi:Flp pilus assembly secretin CpaC/tetratricopeptide (TPR) repeat protein